MVTTRCTTCGDPTVLGTSCSSCGLHPQDHDGIPLLAPDIAEGFDPTQFEALVEVEGRSFWFRARNRIVAWALARWFPDSRLMLEVGCGTGFVLQAIAESFPNLELYALDIHVAGLILARERVPRAHFVQGDARELPFRDAFDVVSAFDVVEHIPDDAAVLASLRDSVRPGGGVILTVPQHPFLWSAFDMASHHVRRYGRRELQEKVRASGLELLHTTSFVSLLMPAMALSRLVTRSRRERSIADELRKPRALEVAFDAISKLEFALLRNGVRLSCGGSRLVVARRPA